MKKYKEYMDGVHASDTLHQRLLELEEPGKQPAPWKKYSSIAAALVLVCGLGAWGLRERLFAPLYEPLVDRNPEIADEPQPDIALIEPGDVDEPGEKTIGGYDVTSGGMVAHYILPYIDYGGLKPSAASSTQVAADWDIPAGGTKRELSQDEIAALMGGEDAVNTHLDWGGYEITGWAAWNGDGSFWGAYINGEKIPAGLPQSASYPCPVDRFEFAVTADQLPPTCIIYSDSVTQEVRGLTVTANGLDSVATPEGGVDASTRRVSFMKDGYGYCFTLVGTSRALTEERVSRLVRWVAEDSRTWTAEELGLTVLGEGTYTCPDCGETFPADQLRAHVHSFDTCPACGEKVARGSEHGCAANASATVTCPDCGVSYPAGEEHYHTQGETHICPDCGATYMTGTEHHCELCNYPVAPTPGTHICEVCGQSLPEGVEHSHGATCPTCGESYGRGTAHTCRQGDHHQEQHRGGHH